MFSAEAKSVTIRRMQSNLEEWDRELQEICKKKAKNGGLAEYTVTIIKGVLERSSEASSSRNAEYTINA